MRVVVHNNDVSAALRKLKRKLQKEGVFQDMRRIEFYEKPAEKRVREKREAIRRAKKNRDSISEV